MKSEKRINYSVIIPHRNTPDLLYRCLKSIPERDDLEIIVIDDNSDPTVVDFEHFPGYSDCRVKLFLTKEGRGAGFARNIGIDSAQGRWLLFADADDYFTPAISSVLEKYKEDEIYDAVFFNVKKVNEKGKVWGINLNRIVENYLKGYFLSEKVLRYAYWSPWSRMLKRKIVVEYGVKFEELPIGNDMMFVLNATKYANRIAAISEIVYMYYYPTEGSQTTQKYSKANRLLRLDTRLRLRDFYKSVQFPFMFPILREYAVLTDKSIRPLLKKYNYNMGEDLYNFIKYGLGKIFKII